MRGHESVDYSLLTEVVEISLSRKTGEILHISLLNMEELQRWFVEPDTVYAQQFVAVLQTRTKSRKTQKVANVVAATIDPLLGEAKTERLH